MILIAGFQHPTYGLVYDEVIELDEASGWIVRAADFLDRVSIFFIDGRIVSSSEFSPIVMHATEAERLIHGLNTACP